jgi:bifunctional non-homologous end joining protein LigD
VKRPARTRHPKGEPVVAAPHPPSDSERAGELPALSFALTHLDKVFFPRDGYTKGDLLRYYTRIAAQILPAIRDRPLALKRYPDGVGRPFFFQQNAPAADRLPPGVRVEPVRVELDGAVHARVVGGTLATLLYTVQLGCIGVDPWHARVASLDTPDYAILDLDPGPKVPFSRVVQVALWVKSELDAAGLHGIAKTSGSRGIHLYIPLPRQTSDTSSLALAQRIATTVARAHPAEATVTRGIEGRGADTVYVDYLQNSRGKTVAAAYCVRAVDGARVSMPLRWDELTPGLDPQDFNLGTASARIARVGDLWSEAIGKRNSTGAVRQLLKSAARAV